jgi:hypothetical protein
MPESDAEIVLHDDPKIPHNCNVHYLVNDVVETVAKIEGNGCRVIVAPFDVRIGKCAVVSDPSGNQLNLIDMTRGPVQYNLRGQGCERPRVAKGVCARLRTTQRVP